MEAHRDGLAVLVFPIHGGICTGVQKIFGVDLEPHVRIAVERLGIPESEKFVCGVVSEHLHQRQIHVEQMIV
jgi:hypothetical protein